MHTLRALALIVVSAVWLAAVSESRAQIDPSMSGMSHGVSVAGAGQVRARPDALQVYLQVQATAELSDDATIKFREARKRVLDAFNGLKLEGMAITEHGVRIGNDAGGDDEQPWGNAAPTAKTQVSVSAKLELRLVGIRQKSEDEVMELVSRLVDTAKDSGAQVLAFGGTTYNRYGYPRQNGALVQFLLTDLRELQEQAYQKAVDDARKKAERLAALTQLKLGQALAIQDTTPPATSNMNQMVQYYGNAAAIPELGDEASEQPIRSEHFSPTTVAVRVAVRYAIAEAQP